MIAVITTHYNPCNYKRLLNNYFIFKENLTKDADLFVAELSFNNEFRIPEALHIHGSEKNIMWQKERMLNLIVENLDPKYDIIAWIDADILFADPDWLEKALEKLEKYPVVQLFGKMISLNKNFEIDHIKEGWCLNKHKGGKFKCPGGAWIAKRWVFPLIDFNIIGGGDSAQVHAWDNNFNNFFSSMLNPEYLECYRDAGKIAYDKVQGNYSYIDCDIVHLYHGTRQNRRYVQRYEILKENRFDPKNDIKIDNGIYSWNSDKPILHGQLKEYFSSRDEDN